MALVNQASNQVHWPGWATDSPRLIYSLSSLQVNCHFRSIVHNIKEISENQQGDDGLIVYLKNPEQEGSHENNHGKTNMSMIAM
jgi:hypothetical protein